MRSSSIFLWWNWINDAWTFTRTQRATEICSALGFRWVKMLVSLLSSLWEQPIRSQLLTWIYPEITDTLQVSAQPAWCLFCTHGLELEPFIHTSYSSGYSNPLSLCSECLISWLTWSCPMKSHRVTRSQHGTLSCSISRHCSSSPILHRFLEFDRSDFTDLQTPNLLFCMCICFYYEARWHLNSDGGYSSDRKRGKNASDLRGEYFQNVPERQWRDNREILEQILLSRLQHPTCLSYSNVTQNYIKLHVLFSVRFILKNWLVNNPWIREHFYK